LQGGDGAAYLDRLKTLANPLGSQCEFVGPVFDQQVLISEYQAGAVFVYPSLAEFGESLGLAPLEAMAAGCAVIVSNLRCFDDYVEDGVTGLKFDHTTPDPVEALAARLLYLISEERVLERIAEAGHHAAYRFHAEPIAARMLEDFASMVGDRPPAQSAFSTASGQARK
jgi:glycosyltransferase involved in cell wall biosynthesis